jgi:hypothetical protein
LDNRNYCGGAVKFGQVQALKGIILNFNVISDENSLLSWISQDVEPTFMNGCKIEKESFCVNILASWPSWAVASIDS